MNHKLHLRKGLFSLTRIFLGFIEQGLVYIYICVYYATIPRRGGEYIYTAISKKVVGKKCAHDNAEK